MTEPYYQYNDEIPENTRLSNHADFFKDELKILSGDAGRAVITMVQQLTRLAETGLYYNGKYFSKTGLN